MKPRWTASRSGKSRSQGRIWLATLMLVPFLFQGTVCAKAQEALDDEPLNLDRAITKALENNWQSIRASTEIDLAGIEEETAFILKDPEIRLGHRETRESEWSDMGTLSDTHSQQRVDVRFFLPRPVLIASQRRRSLAAQGLARASLEEVQHETAMEVRTLYTSLVFLESELLELERLVQIRQTRRELLAELAKTGQITKAKTITADASYTDALSTLQGLNQQIDTLCRHLARLTGLDEITPSQLDLEPRSLSFLDGIPLPFMQDFACEHRAELKALDAEEKMAEEDFHSARAERYPSISHVQGGYRWDDRDQGGDSWSAEIAFNIPLFGAWNDTDRLPAAKRTWLETEIGAVRRDIRAHVEETYQNLLQARQGFEQKKKTAMPLLEEIRSTLDVIRQQGGHDPDLVRELAELAVSSRRALNETRFELEQAMLYLEDALGASIPSLQRLFEQGTPK